MKFSKMLKGSITLASALVLVACGNGGSTAAEGENAPAADYKAALEQEPTGEKIVLVTNNAGDERREWLEANFTEAGFNVEIVPLGGSEVTARVIAEVANPTTNVVWGPSNDNFDMMIEAGALAPWEPSWLTQVEGHHDANGFSYPYEIQPKLFVANADKYKADNAPKTVNDLWEKAEFHGKYTVPADFGGATNRAIIASILGQHLDPEGELGVSAEGWEDITAFFKNGVRTPEGENDYQNMISGKTPITYSFASGLHSKAEEFGPAHLIYFDNGQPDNANEVGVVNHADAEVLAESYRLADYIGSAAFIGAYAADNGNIVVNADATDQMTAIAKDVHEKYAAQDLDWETINANMDEWVAKIELEIVGQ